MTKVVHLFVGFARCILIPFQTITFDYIFVHRGITPLGPPVVEWILHFLLKKKIVFDYDDAIWIPSSIDEPFWHRWMKSYWKVGFLIRWSYRVSCGNHYLMEYALRYNPHSFYNPTTVNTTDRHTPARFVPKSSPLITLGWTGTHTTLPHLEGLRQVLVRLESDLPVRLLVICNGRPDLALSRMEYRRWSEASEIEDLLEFDIGLMPLPHNEWTEGKCGLKLIQYLSLEIPAVASSVGVNSRVVDNGISGFLCSSDDDWYERVKQLSLDEGLRKRMGQEGRKKIVNHFSTESNSANFLGLFA